MSSYDTIIEKDGYLVDSITGERVIFYECDPSKNTECTHSICRTTDSLEDEGEFGLCGKCLNPDFKKDGSKPFYAVLKEGTYWGREYIEEV